MVGLSSFGSEGFGFDLEKPQEQRLGQRTHSKVYLLESRGVYLERPDSLRRVMMGAF